MEYFVDMPNKVNIPTSCVWNVCQITVTHFDVYVKFLSHVRQMQRLCYVIFI
jgi:hypothetical protein